MEDWIAHFSYLGVVVALLLSGFGLPLPEDVPLLIAGYLCATGAAELWIMLPMTFLAVLGADFTLYALGRRWGHHVPRLLVFGRFLDARHLRKAELAFCAHGGKTLFLARFLPGLRAATFFTAGIFRIPFWKMAAFDGAAAVLSVPTLVMLGWFFAGHFDELRKWSRGGQWLAAGLLVAAVVFGVFWHRRRKQRALKVSEASAAGELVAVAVEECEAGRKQ